MRWHRQRTEELWGDIFVSLQSALPNSEGIKTKDDILLSWKESEKQVGVHMDIAISEQLRNWGIGTFIWSEIYQNIPKPSRDHIVVSGLLRADDPSEPRDSFLKKLVCFGSDPLSYFLLTDTGQGMFRGRLNSMNLKHFPKIEVSII